MHEVLELPWSDFFYARTYSKTGYEKVNEGEHNNY